MTVAEISEVPQVSDDEPLLPENERPMLVTPDHMRRILGVSKTTLYRWSHHPRFPVHRNGHLVLYPWRDVVEFVREAIKHHELLPGRNDLMEPKPAKRKRA